LFPALRLLLKVAVNIFLVVSYTYTNFRERMIDNESGLCVSLLGIYSQSYFCKTPMPTIVVPFAQKRLR